MSVPIPVEVFDESRLSAVGRTGLVGTGPDVAFDRLARAAASFCDAPLAFVTLVDDRVSWYVAAIGYPEDAERCGPVGESFCKLVIGSGERLVVGDTRRDESTLDHPAIDSMGVAAWAGYPVKDRHGAVLGSFCVIDTVTRTWTDDQVELLGVLAAAAADEIEHRVAVASERTARLEAEQARLHVQELLREQARMMALFQRSLLPSRLATVAGIDSAFRYESQNDVAQIGGDWYDLILRTDGRVVLIIGDLAGHDLEAVVAMAQVRHAVHVAALRLPGPVELVNLANDFFYDLGITRFASLTCVYWDPADDTLTHVSAGHNPTIIVDAEGAASFLEGGQTRLLGVDRRPLTVDAARRSFSDGERLVLFTDGLFETRSTTIDDGLERVRSLATRPGLTPTEMCDHLLTSQRPAHGWLDDVALMIVDRTGPAA